MKPVELEGLTLSQLSALSLLEISSSELEAGEPTSASSNFLLRPPLAIASIWPRLAWRGGAQRAGGGPATGSPAPAPAAGGLATDLWARGKKVSTQGLSPIPIPSSSSEHPEPGQGDGPQLLGVRSCGALAALVDKQSDTWGAPKLPPNRQESCETPGTRLRGPESC